MKRKIFAGNWKMHKGPQSARDFMHVFLQRYRKQQDREVWFFPPAVAVPAVSKAIEGRTDLRVGAQNIHWEREGAFTGELSVPMLVEAGGTHALVGHSERRHIFGETDEETGRKVRALIDAGLTPVLCVGEKLEERESGRTVQVVERQLSVLSGLGVPALKELAIAYEPVWAIGTGRTATPDDAGKVHQAIRTWFIERGKGGGLRADEIRVLYGGSVKPSNVQALMANPEIDGVLVGGASLDPESWVSITSVTVGD